MADEYFQRHPLETRAAVTDVVSRNQKMVREWTTHHPRVASTLCTPSHIRTRHLNQIKIMLGMLVDVDDGFLSMQEAKPKKKIMKNIGPQGCTVISFEYNSWNCFVVRIMVRNMMDHDTFQMMIQKGKEWHVVTDATESFILSEHGPFLFKQQFMNLTKMHYFTEEVMWTITLPQYYGTRNILQTSGGDLVLFYHSSLPLLLVSGKNGDIVRVIDHPGDHTRHLVVGETYANFRNHYDGYRQWQYVPLNPFRQMSLSLSSEAQQGLYFSRCGSTYLAYDHHILECYWTDQNILRWTAKSPFALRFNWELLLDDAAQYLFIHIRDYVDVYEMMQGTKVGVIKTTSIRGGMRISTDRAHLYGISENPENQLHQMDLFSQASTAIKCLFPMPKFMHRCLINKLFHF